MHQRLFEITLHLLQRGAATADELAERFEVSRRTIYRDIDALSLAGIPLYTEKGRGGGIRMLPEYTLDKAMFTGEEQQRLLANLQSLAALGAPDTEPLLDKLAALFGRSDEGWLWVDFAPWAGGGEAREQFRLLREAILQRRELAFDYVGAEGQPARRVVHPCHVVFRGQGWYLHAFCKKRRAYRFFKLNRMSNTAPTGAVFAPLDAPPQPDGDAPPGPLQTVRLRLDASVRFRAADEFAPHQITPQEDGGVVVECELPQSGNWLVGYLLSFGPAAEVLGPPALRRQVAEALQAMAGRYRT